jgi:hypothetical protein
MNPILFGVQIGGYFSSQKAKNSDRTQTIIPPPIQLKSLSVRDRLLFFGGITRSILVFKKTDALIPREFFNILPNLPSKSF